MTPEQVGSPQAPGCQTLTPDFRQEQRGVAVAMLGAAVMTTGVLGLVYAARLSAVPTAFVDRLQSAIHIDLLVVAWLAAAIANVARIRFFSERDIAASSAGAGSQSVRVAGAILQNTLEQVTLAVFAHIAVAATFDPAQSLIVALASLFAVGRLLFWIGYRHGAKARAFGFALTFYPSVVALIASAATILLG